MEKMELEQGAVHARMRAWACGARTGLSRAETRRWEKTARVKDCWEWRPAMAGRRAGSKVPASEVRRTGMERWSGEGSPGGMEKVGRPVMRWK